MCLRFTVELMGKSFDSVMGEVCSGGKERGLLGALIYGALSLGNGEKLMRSKLLHMLPPVYC